MKRLGILLVATGLSGAVFAPLLTAEPTRDATQGAVSQADDSADVLNLAAKIDQAIARRWQAEKIVPASGVDDSAFMRRVSLDIAGKIPAVADLHEFLEDTSPDKRHKLVERLLESPAYVTHFAKV